MKAKVLSLRPEWAWAVLFADPPKIVENRSWRTKHRGRLLIHASLRPGLWEFELPAELVGRLAR